MAEMINFNLKDEEYFINIANLAYVKMDRENQVVTLRTMIQSDTAKKRFTLNGEEAAKVISQIDKLSK